MACRGGCRPRNRPQAPALIAKPRLVAVASEVTEDAARKERDRLRALALMTLGHK